LCLPFKIRAATTQSCYKSLKLNGQSGFETN
jgi:hypothetical protein